MTLRQELVVARDNKFLVDASATPHGRRTELQDTICRVHDVFQNFLYRIALFWHCHQRQDRSFLIRGRQVPLCARCTGILVGSLALPLYVSSVRWPVAVTLITAFGFDSVSQLLRLRSSNNVLRFVTGVGFSVAILGLLVEGAKWLWSITL
jgi:uncharacterized membrane protein